MFVLNGALMTSKLGKENELKLSPPRIFNRGTRKRNKRDVYDFMRFGILGTDLTF